jgi:hypothetical protein
MKVKIALPLEGEKGGQISDSSSNTDIVVMTKSKTNLSITAKLTDWILAILKIRKG